MSLVWHLADVAVGYLKEVLQGGSPGCSPWVLWWGDGEHWRCLMDDQSAGSLSHSSEGTGMPSEL